MFMQCARGSPKPADTTDGSSQSPLLSAGLLQIGINPVGVVSSGVFDTFVVLSNTFKIWKFCCADPSRIREVRESTNLDTIAEDSLRELDNEKW